MKSAAAKWQVLNACLVFKGERIRVHHGLTELLWGSIERATQKLSFHGEITVVGLSDITAPIDAIDEWLRMCDKLADEDTALLSSICRKQPDACSGLSTGDTW